MLLIFLLAFIGLSLIGCFEPQPPKVDFINYNLSKVTRQGLELSFLFSVENPNSLAIDLTKYQYKIFINDQEFISETKPGFNIPANSKKIITIPVMISYDKLFGTSLGVLAALAKGGKELTYQIEGTLEIKLLELGLTAPLKATGQIPIPKDIRF